MSTVPEVRVGDHGRRPLLVFGSYPLFQRVRLEWSPEDRERARWVREEHGVRGYDRGADFVVLDGYSIEQSRAIVLANRRGLVRRWSVDLKNSGRTEGEVRQGDHPGSNGDGSFRTFEPTEAPTPAAASELETGLLGGPRAQAITLPCLSIRQPWAWAILNAGKDIENRTWFTNYRGPLLIHASKGCTKAEWLDAAETIVGVSPSDDPVPELSELERGGIVGVCDLYGMLPPGTGDNPWHAFGQYGWQLRSVRARRFRALNGKQGLFRVELTAREVIDLRLDGLLEKVKP